MNFEISWGVKNTANLNISSRNKSPLKSLITSPLIIGADLRFSSPISNQMPKQRRLWNCRHCGFKTDKKVENWQHIRIHMRPEKLLACESCQFVTEYKHHLEYHQRNHSGYKPFKCDKCDYQCVNKSMLNSHLKSHSSVMQYQCDNCKYATKYVHSLKMHLRKYGHQSELLMMDGYSKKRKIKTIELNDNSLPAPPQPPAAQIQTVHIDPHQCILDLRVNSKISTTIGNSGPI